MTKIYLDGCLVYFDAGQKIKLTMMNRFFSMADKYTLNINVPLDILENRLFFGNIQRPETRKNSTRFEAKLLVDDKELFSGSALITEINDTMVKIQLVGGNSDFGVYEKSKDEYIDELPFENLELQTIASANGVPVNNPASTVEEQVVQYGCPGLKKLYMHIPIYDETNDVYLNGYKKSIVVDGKCQWADITDNDEHKSRSLSFLYILRCVIKYMGFDLIECEYDDTPIAHLYICTARPETSNENLPEAMRMCLPHWTIEQYVEQVQNYLNCSIVFNSVGHTAKVLRNSRVINAKVQTLEIEDEYTSEIDDESENKALSSRNLHYSTNDGTKNPAVTYFREEINNYFPHKYFDSYEKLQAFVSTSGPSSMRYIMHCPQGTFITDTLNSVIYTYHVELFGDRVRTPNSDDHVEIKICPATYMTKYLKYDSSAGIVETDIRFSMGQHSVAIVGNPVEEQAPYEYDHSVYLAISHMVSDEVYPPKNVNEDKEDFMTVAFVLPRGSHLIPENVFWFEHPEPPSEIPWPESFSNELENRSSPGEQYGRLSLSLHDPEDPLQFTIGTLHGDSFKIQEKVQSKFMFCTDNIPDINGLFLINNKLYIAKNIEMVITDAGIEKEKTGYFHEIL